MLTGWVAATLVIGGWGTVCLLTAMTRIPGVLHGHLWYGAAILGLCPAIAVLGARRPVSRVWPVFVLLPLIAVLAVPVIATLWNHGGDVPLEIETPILIGFLLITVMGTGNYLGTRYTISALLYAIAIILVTLPSTGIGTDNGWTTQWLGPSGTLCLALGCWSASVSSGRASPQLENYDRLWIDFRDTFGIVWAKRVMERINWTAREEKWPAELGFQGLVWTKEDVTEDERRKVIDRLNHTFRWLLKRFVSDDWIDSRLR